MPKCSCKKGIKDKEKLKIYCKSCKTLRKIDNSGRCFNCSFNIKLHNNKTE